LPGYVNFLKPRLFIIPNYFSKKSLFIVGIFILLCLTFYSPLYSARSGNQTDTINYQSFDLEVGEELVYKVSYAFFSLGEIRMKVIDKVRSDEKVVYRTQAIIDSYKGIPFVDLHEIYESKFNDSIYSYWFRSRTIEKSNTRYVTYDFDYPKGKVYFELGKWEGGIVDNRDTTSIDTYAQDGLSLFYFARQNLYKGSVVNIPTIVNEKVANTTISFLKKRESVEIDVVDYPVDVIAFDGKADFEGVFGFSGKFEGWFSNDNERVPILAKMKVLIGKVRIELIKWTKKNWKPPQAKE
jgi:hypothetical protein